MTHKTSVTQRYDNCMDCPSHVVVADPDPTDRFCDDDQAVLCGISAVRKVDIHQYLTGKPFAFRPVAVSCRPYQKRAECHTPKWCPLNKG